jgi:DNA ligase 1
MEPTTNDPRVKRFAQLFRELDQTTRTSEKLAALEGYFRDASPADAAWALHFLLGRRGRRPVKASALRDWTAAETGLPPWLVEESYDAVGDLAETVALLLEGRLGTTGRERSPRASEGTAASEGPTTSVAAGARGAAGSGDSAAPGFRALIEEHLQPLATLPEPRQREHLFASLALLDATERFLFLKLLTGGFRMGVARTLVVRALAAVAGLAPAIMEHRLMSEWRPAADDFQRLLDGPAGARDPAQPYPFYLASPLERTNQPLAELAGWQVEWKWDGIRAQLLRRDGQAVLWSRGEEIITPAFPEIGAAAASLPEGTVLDGELLAWRADGPLPFSALQRRLNRREAGARLRSELPVVFMAYGVLEHAGEDWRGRALTERRTALEELVRGAEAGWSTRAEPADDGGWVQGDLFASNPDPATLGPGAVARPRMPLQISPLLTVAAWDDVAALRGAARATGAEGLMLKRRDSPYGVGRERGAWWKWKVDPYTVDAVLLAAQPGHGKRAGLFTDYTFGLWRGSELVSFAKAYSGLTADEIQEVDRWVRAHTTGRRGPVRTVTPELVFELAFEGIQVSARHKSGLALRFPRIARWRKDKPASEADTVELLQKLLEPAR